MGYLHNLNSPCPQILINYKGKMGNLAVAKAGRHHLNQEVTLNSIGNKAN